MRTICVQPCPPSASLSVHLPFMGDMGAQADLSLEGGCAGCDVIGNLLIQMGPALGSMGIPICILGCLASVIGALTAVTDIVTDPSAFAEALVNVGESCQCVLQFALPPPAGAVCEMLKTVLGVVNLIAQAVTCVTGLVGDIIQVNVRATPLLLSTDAASKAAGECVSAQGQAMMDALNQKFGSINALFKLILPIVQFLEPTMGSFPGFGPAITALEEALTGFSAGVPIGTPPAEFLSALQDLSSVLNETIDVLNPIVGICP